MFLSQHKNMIGLCYKHWQDIVDIWNMCDILQEPIMEKQIKVLELCLTGHDVLTILSTGYGNS